MILPTKHVREEDTLLGVGAAILESLPSPSTTAQLWQRLRTNPNVATYERFVLALVLLYMLGAIHSSDGAIRKATR